MKYSEAVRLGATLAPQGFAVSRRTPGEVLCANEAARRAVGLLGSPINTRDIFPSLAKAYGGSDCVHEGANIAHYIAIHLNDELRWTREEIADWVVANGYDCEAVSPNQRVKQQRIQEEVAIIPSHA